MRKYLLIALNVIALLGISSMAFAAGATLDAAALGTTCLGAALGIKGAMEGIARNPEVSGKITGTMILAYAFIESLAIYALVISFILLYANPYVA